MRISRLTAGLVTAGLVGFVPLAVTAPANAAALGSTTTLAVSAPFGGATAFDIGDSLSFSGSIKGSDGTSTPSTGTASLQVAAAGSATFTTIATDTTPSSLFFSGITASSNATYKVVFSGGTSGFGSSANTYAASESAPVAVAVARTLKIKTSRLTIKGKVLPSAGKEKIKILQKKGKKYKKFTSVKTNKAGKFTFRAPRRDKFKFAVVVPGNAAYTGNVQFFIVNIF